MFSMINVLFILLTLFVHDSISYYHHDIHHHGDHYGGYGGYGYEGNRYGGYSNGRGNCFSGDSLIKLSNGEYKQISSLKSGDQIVTIDQSKIISTEMILMLDQHISREALFYTLKTKSGHNISLTEYHLIPIKSSNENFNYLFAKQIQIGDLLYVLFNNKTECSPVINITIERKKGYYAPLTIEGTLLVNQVLASCFAYAKNHHLAQFSMFPFRFYYKLLRFISLNDSFYNDNSEGSHWVVLIMFHSVRYFIPQILCLP